MNATTTQASPKRPSNQILNPEEFQILEVTNSGLYNLSISSTLSPAPLFHVTNKYFTFGKPSIVLTSVTEDGPILGFMKLAWNSKDIVGLGHPDTDDVVFEELRCMSKWSKTKHEFEFGPREERRTFVWIRTKARYVGDQPDLELREKLLEASENGNQEDGDTGEVEEGMGEVLAVYKGCQGLLTKMRGTLFLKKHKHEDAEFWQKGRTAQCSDWDLMVLLTACALIEEGRRRARARYVGASNVS